MPELPEVETICRGLQKALEGKIIQSAETRRKDMRFPFPDNLAHDVTGQTILSIRRRAKYILITLSDKTVLVIHLGMSGRIKISPSKPQIQKHDHFIITMNDKTWMVLNDARRFGYVLRIAKNDIEAHKHFASLGPEPLSNQFYAEYLFGKLKKKQTPIKIALLDQRIVAGLGNIYVSEALYQAHISPLRASKTLSPDECQNLVHVIQDTLKRAIEAGGTTLKDYQKADGSMGYFQYQFSVYDKEHHACPDCTCDLQKTGGVKKITQGGRSSFYCETNQI